MPEHPPPHLFPVGGEGPSVLGTNEFHGRRGASQSGGPVRGRVRAGSGAEPGRGGRPWGRRTRRGRGAPEDSGDRRKAPAPHSGSTGSSFRPFAPPPVVVTSPIGRRHVWHPSHSSEMQSRSTEDGRHDLGEQSAGTSGILEGRGARSHRMIERDMKQESSPAPVLDLTSTRSSISQEYEVVSGSRDKISQKFPPTSVPPAILFINEGHPFLTGRVISSMAVPMLVPLTAWMGPLAKGGPLVAERQLLTVQTPGGERQTRGPSSTETEGETAIVGSLWGLCSVDELVEKQQTSTANDLELLQVTLHGDSGARLVNPFLTLKSFQRSDANKVFKPESTRCAVWCRIAVHWMLCIHLTVDLLRPPWLFAGEVRRLIDLYSFLRDRLRAVWQDLTVQHCEMHRASIEVYEISFRFLILFEEMLVDVPEFNIVQHGGLMATVMDKLITGYNRVRELLKQQQPQPHLSKHLVFSSAHEAEFWAYRILLTLTVGSHHAVQDIIHTIPEGFLHSQHIRVALAMHRAVRDNNAMRFFKLQRRCLINPQLILMGILANKFAHLLRVKQLFTLHGRHTRQAPTIPWRLFCSLMGMDGESLEAALDFSWHYKLIQQDAAEIPDSMSLEHVHLTPADLELRRVRAKRFRSENIGMALASLDISRQKLLDPTFTVDSSLFPSLRELVQRDQLTTPQLAASQRPIRDFHPATPTKHPPQLPSTGDTTQMSSSKASPFSFMRSPMPAPTDRRAERTPLSEPASLMPAAMPPSAPSRPLFSFSSDVPPHIQPVSPAASATPSDSGIFAIGQKGQATPPSAAILPVLPSAEISSSPAQKDRPGSLMPSPKSSPKSSIFAGPVSAEAEAQRTPPAERVMTSLFSPRRRLKRQKVEDTPPPLAVPTPLAVPRMVGFRATLEEAQDPTSQQDWLDVSVEEAESPPMTRDAGSAYGIPHHASHDAVLVGAHGYFYADSDPWPQPSLDVTLPDYVDPADLPGGIDLQGMPDMDGPMANGFEASAAPLVDTLHPPLPAASSGLPPSWAPTYLGGREYLSIDVAPENLEPHKMAVAEVSPWSPVEMPSLAPLSRHAVGHSRDRSKSGSRHQTFSSRKQTVCILLRTLPSILPWLLPYVEYIENTRLYCCTLQKLKKIAQPQTTNQRRKSMLRSLDVDTTALVRSLLSGLDSLELTVVVEGPRDRQEEESSPLDRRCRHLSAYLFSSFMQKITDLPGPGKCTGKFTFSSELAGMPAVCCRVETSEKGSAEFAAFHVVHLEDPLQLTCAGADLKTAARMDEGSDAERPWFFWSAFPPPCLSCGVDGDMEKGAEHPADEAVSEILPMIAEALNFHWSGDSALWTREVTHRVYGKRRVLICFLLIASSAEGGKMRPENVCGDQLIHFLSRRAHDITLRRALLSAVEDAFVGRISRSLPSSVTVKACCVGVVRPFSPPSMLLPWTCRRRLSEIWQAVIHRTLRERLLPGWHPKEDLGPAPRGPVFCRRSLTRLRDVMLAVWQRAVEAAITANSLPSYTQLIRLVPEVVIPALSLRLQKNQNMHATLVWCLPADSKADSKANLKAATSGEKQLQLFLDAMMATLVDTPPSVSRDTGEGMRSSLTPVQYFGLVRNVVADWLSELTALAEKRHRSKAVPPSIHFVYWLLLHPMSSVFEAPWKGLPAPPACFDEHFQPQMVKAVAHMDVEEGSAR